MLDMWCVCDVDPGTTPDDHYGIYLDGSSGCQSCEPGPAEERRRRRSCSVALKASPVQTDGSVLLPMSRPGPHEALLRSSSELPRPATSGGRRPHP